MFINFENKESINELYVHDSVYDGFHYDYEKRNITLACKNYFLKKHFRFIFNNVIFCKLQSCSFWASNGYYICHVELKETSKDLDELMKLMHTNPDLLKGSCFDRGINYMIVEFKINSGDTLQIICESVVFEDDELEETEG